MPLMKYPDDQGPNAKFSTPYYYYTHLIQNKEEEIVKMKLVGRSMFMVAATLAVLAFIAGPVSAAKAKKPNILVISR